MHHYLLLVTYTLKDGAAREDFIGEMRDSGLLDTIRSEPGCLEYEYFLSEESERDVQLVEKWESPSHQQTHMRTEHMTGLFPEIKNKYVESTSVTEMQF